MIKARREQEKIRNYKQIIDAAEKIFFTKGFNHSTMNEIAQASEFTKRTVYSYFENKKELYIAVLYRGMKKQNEHFEKVLAGVTAKTGLEKVMLLGWAYYKFAQKYPHYFKITAEYQSIVEDLEKDTDLFRECFEEGEKGISYLKNLIIEGVKDKSITSQINIVETTLSLWISITGIIETVLIKKDYINQIHKINIEKVINESFFLFEKSLRRSENE